MWNVYDVCYVAINSNCFLNSDTNLFAHVVHVSHFRGVIDLAYCITSLIVHEIGLPTICNKWGFTVFQFPVRLMKIAQMNSQNVPFYPSCSRSLPLSHFIFADFFFLVFSFSRSRNQPFQSRNFKKPEYATGGDWNRKTCSSPCLSSRECKREMQEVKKTCGLRWMSNTDT